MRRARRSKLVICNTIYATDDVETLVLNAAVVAGLIAIVDVIVAVVLQRRSCWIVGAVTRDCALDPRIAPLGTYGIQTAAILAVCAALFAWVQFPSLLVLDAALLFAGTGATAAGIRFRSVCGRNARINTAVMTGGVGVIIGPRVGGIGTASVIAAAAVGGLLTRGLRILRRGCSASGLSRQRVFRFERTSCLHGHL